MPDGKIRFFDRGRVWDFEQCPTHFSPLEGENAKVIDFATAKEAELLAATYDLADLKEYIKATYGASPGNRGKEKTVEMLLDCRYREVDLGSTNPIV
jgi:hypothetical protein